MTDQTFAGSTLRVVRVLSFDPGETTGFADCLIHPGSGRLVVRQGFELRDFDHLSFVFHPAQYKDPGANVILKMQIVCESIRVNHPSFNAHPLKIQGVVEFLAHSVGLPIALQTPSTMEAARRRHPCREIRSQHVRDAAHHAIAWAYKTFKRKLEVEVDERVIKETKSQKAREEALEAYCTRLAEA